MSDIDSHQYSNHTLGTYEDNFLEINQVLSPRANKSRRPFIAELAIDNSKVEGVVLIMGVVTL
jgi:hypothetical protein